ncbi:hypothetical protein DL89DRAFT_309272 [Linderina pennispora]|uniref:ABC transporter domain-containing protein n=1 Tax=Linderina pennispora TaxID=61395 RepID=A0A1Y1WIY9_9FUNG|nr:uncharacterized protein DL89DRAFT_309272 [Linderina pennispora]ORX73186.1 hypothetical protein DL89DRAFT_309272 [Linderina pennispora]
MFVVSSATHIAGFALRCSSIISVSREIIEHATALEKLFEDNHSRYIERTAQVGDTAVKLDRCAFQWGPDKFTLAPTTLCVKTGEFAVVVGRVGSGKSSLLSAICSENAAGFRHRVHIRSDWVCQSEAMDHECDIP